MGLDSCFRRNDKVRYSAINKENWVQLQKSWVKQPLMGWDLSHYGLRHIIQDEAALVGAEPAVARNTSPYAVWRRQGAQVASQRSPILLGHSDIIQHICRWHKALNPKYLESKHSNINPTLLDESLKLV